MMLFSIDTPKYTATGYYLPENKPPYKSPYLLEITDLSTCKTERREANNTCIFESFLSNLKSDVLAVEQDVRMREQGYMRLPNGRFERNPKREEA